MFHLEWQEETRNEKNVAFRDIYLEFVVEEHKYFENVEIEGVSVSSDVPDQPVNEEIFKGAKNRVKNLKEYFDVLKIPAISTIVFGDLR